MYLKKKFWIEFNIKKTLELENLKQNQLHNKLKKSLNVNVN